MEEVEEAVRSLKAGKSPGVDITSELLRRGFNNSPYSDMPEDLGDEGMAEAVNKITRLFLFFFLTKERQPRAMSKLSYHHPYQSFQQDHAPSYPQST